MSPYSGLSVEDVRLPRLFTILNSRRRLLLSRIAEMHKSRKMPKLSKLFDVKLSCTFSHLHIWTIIPGQIYVKYGTCRVENTILGHIHRTCTTKTFSCWHNFELYTCTRNAGKIVELRNDAQRWTLTVRLPIEDGYRIQRRDKDRLYWCRRVLSEVLRY